MPSTPNVSPVKCEAPEAKLAKKKRNGHAKARDMSEASLKNPSTRVRVGHAIRLLGISSSSIYKWMQIGSLPAFDGKDTRSYWKSATFLQILEDRKKTDDFEGRY